MQIAQIGFKTPSRNSYVKNNDLNQQRNNFLLRNSAKSLATDSVSFGERIPHFPFNHETLDFIIPNRTMRAVKPTIKALINDVKIPTAGGDLLNSWYVAPKGNNPVFLFLNGTNSNRTWQQGVVEFFDKHGFGSLIADYRGFGDSPDIKPTEKTLYEDAQASLEYLNNRMGLRDKDLVFWGYSMGGAVARKIAPMNDFRFGIMDSSITNEYAIKDHFIKTGIAEIDQISQVALDAFRAAKNAIGKLIPFDTVDELTKVDYPILFLHAKGDEIVPHEMTEVQYFAVKHDNSNSRMVINEKPARHIYRDWTFKPIEEFADFVESLIFGKPNQIG